MLNIFKRKVKLIEKQYKLFKDGKDTGEIINFICLADAKNVNEIFRAVKKAYPEDKGYWLVHYKDIYKKGPKKEWVETPIKHII